MNRAHKKLVIFHYHLLPGGVTDVVRHSVKSLAALEQLESITIVCGRRDNTENLMDDLTKSLPPHCLLTMEIMTELDYLSTGRGCADPEKIKKRLLERYSSERTVWLIHNYHLGKNWAFTRALNSIAKERNQEMIYQIHDFPECARYANLKVLDTHIEESLYPLTPSLKYCVINARDYGIMKRAGMSGERLHLLENPLPSGNRSSGKMSADSPGSREKILKALERYKAGEGRVDPRGALWLYPVRSIRRKNVLEGGFLAALQDEPVNLILTLPGLSDQEKEYSDLCRSAFDRGLIRGFWGTGTLPDEAGISYSQMISASDLIFSSSVQEGFGYMYLNALLWRKPLIARSLDIMGGFLPLMKDYPACFYNTVKIPADRELINRVHREYSDRFDALKEYIPVELMDKLSDELKSFTGGESLEFSYISPQDQIKVLEGIRDPLYKEECRALNLTELQNMKKTALTPGTDKEDELYHFYGEESYRKSFSKILESFSKTEEEIGKDGEGTDTLDKRLRNEFSRLEFLRLLYR